MSNDQRHPNPRVIIVGAGICGLMMSLLLDKAGITHHVFERSSFIQARGRGSILSVSGNILPVFEQLNLLDKLYKISLRNSWTNLYNSKLKHIGKVGVENHLELTGYDFLIISRSQLYDILFAHIPKDRISFNKRVLSMRKCVSGTRIHCSDNSIYESDIVIGADGAYSAVRHNMHRMMKADGELSVRDTKEMAIPFMCLVGTTGHMDPERYPQLKDPLNHLHHVIGSTGYSWTVITIPEDRFCWSVMVQVKDQAEAKEQRFRNSEWFPKAYDDLTAQVKDFPITFGGTLGDLIAETTEDRISKFMLEEKLFERWHYNNIVLIGDACHKMLSTSGQGSMSAMQDAVILANCLYDLKDLSPESITAAFEDYRNQRFNEAKKQVVISKLSSQICNGQTFMKKIIRSFVLKVVPDSFKARYFRRAAAYRPQVSFLPQVKDKGIIKSLPNPPSKRLIYEEAVQRKRRAIEMNESNESCNSSSTLGRDPRNEKRCLLVRR